MRIIGGKFKRINLVSIKNSENLRATSDYIRETIFNIIGEDILDKNFLELFAGSGAVSIEALSRGAKKIFLVEKNRKNTFIIKKNLQKLDVAKDSYKIFTMDCFKFLKLQSFNNPFDIIFADPPYNKGFIEKLLNNIKDFPFISNDNLIILECFKKESFKLATCFKILKEKIYGDTKLIFLNLKKL